MVMGSDKSYFLHALHALTLFCAVKWHYNSGILSTFLSLLALEVVVVITSGAASDDKVGIMTTLCDLWHRINNLMKISSGFRRPLYLNLTHCGLVMPYDGIDLSQYILAHIMVLVPYDTRTTNVDLSSVSLITFNWGQFHKRYISQEPIKVNLKRTSLKV